MSVRRNRLQIIRMNMFEKRVLKRLSIEPKDFSTTYGGYAIFLSNWIKECYNNGESVKQVVSKFNRSRLKKSLKTIPKINIEEGESVSVV